MLHLTVESADLYGFSSLYDYQFVDQGILNLLLRLYDHNHIQYLMGIAVSFLL
jgi:hypothetical protein